MIIFPISNFIAKLNTMKFTFSFLTRLFLIFILITHATEDVLAYGNGSSFTNTDALLVKLDKSGYAPKDMCATSIIETSTEVTITSATLIAQITDIPEHCLVYGVIAPEIQFVVQLPTLWNGRLYVHGNGGDGGESVYSDYGKATRNAALREGFVASFSNTGHDRSAFQGSRWAYNSLQREIDYSYRALHLNTVIVKQIIERFYGREAVYSYFEGCSTGGGQGFRAAQRFPGDFDGIVAGAPVFDPAMLLLYVWNNQQAQEVMQLDSRRLAFLGNWLMSKYDDVDGVEDGVISNPQAIDFDAARDLPRDASGKKGFTAAEIEGLALVYSGLLVNEQRITYGVPIGAEMAGQKYQDRSFIPTAASSAWIERIVPDHNGQIIMRHIMQDWFRYVLFEVDDPERQWQMLDLEKDLSKLHVKAPVLSGSDPDLRRFRDRGGKLLIYNGWADTGVNPYFVMDYYNEMKEIIGDDITDFTRLFFIPGMFHCMGGLNVDRFDTMTTIINWVENNKAPESIPASRIENGKITRTRPLCPYPKVATYRGRGSTDIADNFRCLAPR